MKFDVSIKLKKDNEKKDNGLVYLFFFRLYPTFLK